MKMYSMKVIFKIKCCIINKFDYKLTTEAESFIIKRFIILFNVFGISIIKEENSKQ